MLLLSARDGSVPGGRREYKVGQYTVELQSFENTALPSLCVKQVTQHDNAIDGLLTMSHETVLSSVKLTSYRRWSQIFVGWG